MKKYGLLGKDISYSFSKTIHEAIGKHFNLDLEYYICDLEEKELFHAINKLKENEFLGFNITIPYKNIIVEYCDMLTEVAKKVGAVNVVYVKNDKVIGDNTDYYGFLYLLENNKIEVKNKNVYLLGAGGAAKTCYKVLEEQGANIIVVKNNKADETFFKKVIRKEEIDKKWADLYINATPVGTFPDINKSFIENSYVEDKIVIDLIYNPEETQLMKSAKKAYNGREMLLIQALYAQKLWNGINYNDEDIDILRKEVFV